MNELVKQEISNIISNVNSPRRQYPVAKHQIVSLTELGIIDLMPANFGYTDAAAVIEAAQDAGGKQFGEGDTATSSNASKLFQLLNAPEETTPPTENIGGGELTEITEESIDALLARKESLNYGKEEIEYAVSCHISELKAIYGKTTDKVAEFKRLLSIGNGLFEAGYRLRETNRVCNGVRISVPDEAIMFRDVDAYYIGTAAAHKIIYVAKA